MTFRWLGVVLAIFLLLQAGGTANGGTVYRWKDDSGAVHITNSPESAPAKFRKKLVPMKSVTIEPFDIEPYSGSGRIVDGSSVVFDPDDVKISVTGLFNGQVKRMGFVDTGSGLVVITTKLAIALGYDLKNARKGKFRTPAGQVRAPVVELESLQIGSALVENVLVAVIDFDGRGAVSAIIGMNFLSHFAFEIDHGKGEVAFTKTGG